MARQKNSSEDSSKESSNKTKGENNEITTSIIRLPSDETIKVSVTLQQQSLDELREMGCQGSLSKQIRASVELDVLLRKKVKEGYEISLKAPDGKLYKLELPN